ncbi:hypothetical protein MLD38_000508 [Melastoma candidum]|uniref:Uncharacterized protein n=1 Tax=Melastoma candidum TaxID=119954 RepID=A0ACB9SA94_9MYRT|nr:hypothetical protein MLD38_000508 [Melastoma candidum]
MAGSTESSAGSPRQPQLPPGFRFHPTDEELVVHYLMKKASSSPLPVSIIAEVDIYKFDPWELPAKAAYGQNEWYFFSPRDRKYPNGARPNRAATSGYWKATGSDRPVMSSMRNQKVGVKKALVFYGGKPLKGTKTSWIMHEYRLLDKKPLGIDFSNKKNSLRLDDWVLCRIYRKNDARRSLLDPDRDDSVDETIDHSPPSLTGARYNEGVSRNLADSMRPILSPLFDDSQCALYDGMITNFPLFSSTIKPESGIFPPLPSNPSSHLPPMKRPLPSTPYYWDEKDGSTSAEASQTSLEINRPLNIHDTENLGDDQGAATVDSSTVGGSNGIFASLLSQMPQSSSSFASLNGDGGFRHPYHPPTRGGLNWYAG